MNPGPAALVRFWRDRRGVSALEFALVAPVLILLYLGLAELSQGMSAKRRVTHAASVLGDLTAQTDKVTMAELDDILNGASTVILPFSATGLKLRITSVTADANGVPKADWSRPKGGMTAYGTGQQVPLPAGLLSAGESLVVSEASYTYSSPVASVLPKPLTFNEKFYLRSRKGSKVACSDCPAIP